MGSILGSHYFGKLPYRGNGRENGNYYNGVYRVQGKFKAI